MGESLAIETRIAQAEARWPGLQFKRKTRDEACSPCPWCGGDDRFVIRGSGWYSCRPASGHCSREGWIDENNPTKPSKEKLLEIRIAALERKTEENSKRISALERIARCTDHERYHQQMDADDMRCLWYEQGFTDDMIDRYQLGICYNCPTCRDKSSLTIPVINGGKLVNIRHRLIGAENGDKYRPHMAGLGNTLFHADSVYAEDASSILVVEGEKKAIVTEGHIGGNVVGTMGKAGFQKSWASRFERFGEVLIVLDPDAMDKAFEMATWFAGRARVVTLPTKPDDFFTIYNGTVEQFREFLRMARRVHATD